MNEYNKPPLGCEPGYIHAEARAKELADAISRRICDNDFHHCKTWAEELMIQIEIAQKFKPIDIIGLTKSPKEYTFTLKQDCEDEDDD